MSNTPTFFDTRLAWGLQRHLTDLLRHLGLAEDYAPRKIVKIGWGSSSSSTPISAEIMEESSMELGGSTSTLPSRDHAVFLDSEFMFVVPASSSVALTIDLVELCGIESRITL